MSAFETGHGVGGMVPCEWKRDVLRESERICERTRPDMLVSGMKCINSEKDVYSYLVLSFSLALTRSDETIALIPTQVSKDR